MHSKYLKISALFIFSALFLLVFSLWTSPAYKNWYGCDASFFTMAGRGIVNGWVPYRDFFDLKGPYFFFMEALGQFICEGRFGAFIIQIFSLFFSLLLIIKTLRLFVSVKKTAFVTGIFLIFHVATLWGGNTLEEFMLPLNLLAIYLILFDYQKYESIKSSTALITGLCFSVILFSKVTVASPIIGIVLAIIIHFAKNKRFMELFEFLLYAFLGVLIGTTPIFVYFFIQGNLTDMLYSVFIFAFKRSVDFGTKFNLRWELKISGCYFAIIFALCQLIPHKNKKIKSGLHDFMLTMVLTCAIVTAVVLHLGDPFIYYFTTVYPTLMLTFILMFLLFDPLILFRSRRVDIPLIAFAVTLCYFASHTASTLNTVIYDRDNGYYEEYVNCAKDMAKLIPYADRDKVYSFNMDMQWFEINKMLPCYTYTINLQFFVALDPRIQDNIINKLETDPPKWIVIGGDLSSYLPEINEVVNAHYDQIYSNAYAGLYLLGE